MEKFNNNIVKIVQDLGLKKEPAKVYLASLQLGGGTVSEIAQFAMVERTGIYYHLKELMSLGLLKLALRGKRKIYLPANPKKLAEILDERKKNLLEAMPALQVDFSASMNRFSNEYYQGTSDMMKFYEEVGNIFENAGRTELRIIGQIIDIVKKQLNLLPSQTPQKKRPPLNVKAILPASQRALVTKRDPYLVWRYNLPQAKLKFIEDKYYNRLVAIAIIADKIIMIDAKNYFASISRNKNMAELLKTFFDFSWDKL